MTIGGGVIYAFLLRNLKHIVKIVIIWKFNIVLLGGIYPSLNVWVFVQVE